MELKEMIDNISSADYMKGLEQLEWLLDRCYIEKDMKEKALKIILYKYLHNNKSNP